MKYLGVASVMEPLAKNLKAQTLCLQFDYENSYDTIGDMADNLIPVSTPLLISSSTSVYFTFLVSMQLSMKCFLQLFMSMEI